MTTFEETIIQYDRDLTPIENLLTSLKNSLESVMDLIENINKIVVNKDIDPIDSNFDYEYIKDTNSNKIDNINLNETDELMFKLSLKEFEINLKFNIY